MDVLDKYKDVWKNQSNDNQTLSKIDVYKIMQSKSTSIVKWIFIIGVLEFVFWLALNFVIPFDRVSEVYDKLHLQTVLKIVYVIHHIIVVVFLFSFYKNYSSISVVDDTKLLLKKILKTRKTVKYYVIYNVVGGLVISVVLNYMIISHPDGVATIFDAKNISISPDKMTQVYILSQVVFLAVLLVFFTIFYQLLYGFLLRKLKRNYKELSNLEALN